MITQRPQTRPTDTQGPQQSKRKNRPTVTQSQIAERAKSIWQSKGYPMGRDEENWREAEAQLLAECRDF